MPAPRDVPEGFVKFVTGRDGGNIMELCRKWNASVETVHRWLQETKLMERVFNPPLPKDWNKIAPTRTRADLVLHYRVSPRVIKQWADEAGVKPKPKGQRPRSQPATLPKHDARCDTAADFLRGVYSNVHRCDIQVTLSRTWGQVHNIPDKGRGRYFVEGVGVLTNKELLELAKRHGHETLRV